MTEFDDLASARAATKEFVEKHFASVERFYQEDGNVYRLTEGEGRENDGKVRGLTSTYTSLESQLESQPTSAVREKLLKRLSDYTSAALKKPDDWQSSGSAWIYSRVRSLATITRYGHESDDTSEEAGAALKLLDEAWKASDERSGGSFGVRELTDKPGTSRNKRSKYPYFANAYLTYWTLFTTRRLTSHLNPNIKIKYDRRTKAAGDWMNQTLAEQIAFYVGKSPHTDPQQLAYAIAAVVSAARSQDLVKNARTYDLVHRGLDAFFDQQSDKGDWDRGKPLFNYARSGNAYCYTYETLAELLALCTDSDVEARGAFAAMLRPYWRRLVGALDYASETASPLGRDGVGWASGHEPHRLEPESWATASVFRFAQRLRLLLGYWTSSEAKHLLGARVTTQTRTVLGQRGASWNTGHGGAGAQLATNWLLPLVAHKKAITDEVYDPDEKVIPNNQGRSAILYGPPGTGKTTMVEALAGELSWPFVEITPAHFLNEGMDQVSARADMIFRQMMELDRCVVLLDEIDELVQRRVQQAEALERFFTTTMLPRLAKLWEMGKVLFFANTNNVLDIDPAIRRSSRFDAAILVLPPGKSTKASKLAAEGITVSTEAYDAIDSLLSPIEEAESDNEAASSTGDLVWFPLLRFDQLESMTRSLKAAQNEKGGRPLESKEVGTALSKLGHSLKTQDWINSVEKGQGLGASDKEETGTGWVIRDLKALIAAQRRDSSLVTVIHGTGLESINGVTRVENTKDMWHVKLGDQTDLEAWAAEHNLTLSPDGSVTKVSPIEGLPQ